MLIQLTPPDDETMQMFLICHDEVLRGDILSELENGGEKLAHDLVFERFDILPKQRNVILGIEHLGDCNLRPVIRYFLAHADSWSKLAIAKRSWDPESRTELEKIVEQQRKQAEDFCSAAQEKVKKLPSGSWRAEQVERLSNWLEFPELQYATVTVGEGLKGEIERHLPSFLPFEMKEDEAQISSKPPVLHWTPLPLDGELQVILRISFTLSGPDDATFREICRHLRSYGEHQYEWTGGILLTADAVRCHLERVTPTDFEISGRVAPDELEGADADRPMSLVWPFIGVTLKHVLGGIEHLPHMAHTIEIIPYSAEFYTPDTTARAFELTTFMATACSQNRVASKIDGILYEVDLKLLLPDGPFTSISKLTALEPSSSPRSSRAESLNGQKPDVLTPLEATSPGGLSVSHNKGRRVSFGSIKLMTESTKSNGVDEYVDSLIQDTMDLRTLYVE